MWGAIRIGLFGAIASLSGAASAAAEPVKLTGEAIESTVTGAIVELDSPLGTKIPVRFSRDGLMAGEAGALTGYLGAARDRGRWWVDSDRLCMKWFRWFEAEAHCFNLRQQGARIFWNEQSGRSGTATIAGRFDDEPVMPAYAAASVMQNPVKPAPAPRKAESTEKQGVRPSAVAPPRAEPRESQRAKAGRALAPAAEPGTSSAQPAVKSVVTAAEAPTVPAQSEEPRAHARFPSVSHAVPPLPVRLVTRRSAPPESDVRIPSFSVIRVAHDDVLNVRIGPSEYHQRVGALPPDGRDVRIIGTCRGLWCPIRHGRLSGWVNSYYLAAELPSASAFAEAR